MDVDIHWFAYRGQVTQPPMNTKQSNGNQALSGNQGNNNPMDISVAETLQSNKGAHGQDSEKNFENSFCKKRSEEFMTDLDINFETKIRKEEAKLEKREPELEMQI